MTKINTGILFYFILLFACSGPEKEAEVKEDFVADNAEASMEERRIKGDTLALSPDLLSKALPDEVDGYVKSGEIQKAEDKSIGSNWSLVSQSYRKGNSMVNIILSDYNGAYGLFAGATAMFSTGTEVRNDEEISRPFQEGNIKGWETFNRESKQASLILARKDRFIITIEGEEQADLETVKKFARQIDLNKIL